MNAVDSITAARLTYGVVLRQLVTRGRLLGLLAVGAIVVVVSWAVGASDEIDDRLEAGVQVIASVGFTIVVPVVSLVFAAAALGDTREDGTLVYLWLRPMHRWPIVVGAWAAALTVSVPVTLVPLVSAAALSGGGGSLIGGTAVATVIGVIAYSAIFLLLGLFVKNPIAWGLGYVLVWEGVLASFGSSIARLSVRGYTRSILTSVTGVDLDLGDLSYVAGVAVPLVASAVALVWASRRLSTMDVA